MGQYLTTGLIYEISVPNSAFKSMEKSKKKTFLNIQQALFGIQKSIFTVVKKTDYSYKLRIKDKVLSKEFIPFLSAFYEDYYRGEGDCLTLLEELKKRKTPEKWFDLIENGESYECFQGSPYPNQCTIRVNGQRVEISYQFIMLTMEGKIMMEDYGKHFLFFEKMIARAYADFTLGNLMVVDMI